MLAAEELVQTGHGVCTGGIAGADFLAERIPQRLGFPGRSAAACRECRKRPSAPGGVQRWEFHGQERPCFGDTDGEFLLRAQQVHALNFNAAGRG